MKNRVLVAAICGSFMIAPALWASELTIEQSVVAEDMKELVLQRAILVRITEMCTEFSIDEAGLQERLTYLQSQAVENFSSREEFEEATGSNNPGILGEEMRQYFANRGLQWESSSEDYCELAQLLYDTPFGIGEFLTRAE